MVIPVANKNHKIGATSLPQAKEVKTFSSSQLEYLKPWKAEIT